MRLLMVVPHQDRATGNWITAARLRQGLTARGHAVTVVATTGEALPLHAAVTAAAPHLALLLHAWRSGRPWLAAGCPQPYAVLLTGTDINIGLHDPVQAPVITTVLARAAAVLAQDPATVATLRLTRPDLAGRLHFLPPGIVLGNASSLPGGLPATAAGEKLLLCPAGIRPVKGVVELLAMCDPLVQDGYRFRLVFCGPVLDEGYGRHFLAELAKRSWATYLGIVPPAAMPALLRRTDLVLSNSCSEGLPNALVEAAALGRPILASAIPGNAAVVIDGVNGLLFADPPGFRQALRRLLGEPARLQALVRPDPGRFDPHREADTLERLLNDLLVGTACPTVPGDML
jgi:glycosyltransferase involved in cell wall biosynthesis